MQLYGHNHHYLKNNPSYVEKVKVCVTYNSVTTEPRPIVIISVEFFAERLSSVYSAKAKS